MVTSNPTSPPAEPPSAKAMEAQAEPKPAEAEAEEVKPESSIFTAPLKGRVKADARLERKKKNQRKSVVYLAIAAICLGAYSYMYMYDQLQSYLGFNQEIKAIEEQIDNYEVVLSDARNTRDFHKAAYEVEFKEEQDIIRTVFPETMDKLGVIRLMENFATHLNTAYPPFEFSSISFQEPIKEKGYTILPFQTTIHSSQANFERFLGLINLSGNLDPESPDHIRLMAISNISVRDRGVDKAGKPLGVDFTVKLNAYSRS